MIFSPIGEEFFFRGMIHQAYSAKLGNRKANLIEATFFGVTHLAHHGLVLENKGIRFLPSAFIWISLMIAVSYLFSYFRNKSGSIWGAVATHAGFNLGMMASIIYLLHE
jgi:membrane protease YdiL (CAAX protease family)